MQSRHGIVMSFANGSRPIVLIAVTEEHSLAAAIEDGEYAVVEVHIGRLALACARDLRPDVIILGAELPDMPGVEACRLLQNDPRIGQTVPIVILTAQPLTPGQRSTTLQGGAWDLIPFPSDPEELALKLPIYVQARRCIDRVLANGLIDPTTGVHTRPALARRARELGALMSREHGGLACVVFDVEVDQAFSEVGRLLARTTRVCDVVGAWSPTEIAVLAPATDHAGAVKLAHRVAAALGMATDAGDLAPGAGVRVGYEAVANLTYSPIDPVDLLTRAAAAVRGGVPEARSPWVRRFDAGKEGEREIESTPHTHPAGRTSDKRRLSS